MMLKGLTGEVDAEGKVMKEGEPLFLGSAGDRVTGEEIGKLVSSLEVSLNLPAEAAGRKLRGKHVFRVTGAVALAELGVSDQNACENGK